VNILFCAYRDWAVEIFSNVSRKFQQHSFKLITEKIEIHANLAAEKYDLVFFIGWSWFVDKEIIEDYFCICLHPSPLPKYRGGSPIQNQIINGEVKSAVTLFKMDELVDHGPIIFQQEISLKGSLEDIFAEIGVIGAIGVEKIISDHPNNALIPQIESEATYFERRKPAMSEISASEIKSSTSIQLHNKVRCLQIPYPRPYIVCADGKKLYLIETAVDD
jgi:methionyl-tRNA formyltransferase